MDIRASGERLKTSFSGLASVAEQKGTLEQQVQIAMLLFEGLIHGDDDLAKLLRALSGVEGKMSASAHKYDALANEAQALRTTTLSNSLSGLGDAADQQIEQEAEQERTTTHAGE